MDVEGCSRPCVRLEDDSDVMFHGDREKVLTRPRGNRGVVLPDPFW
jgi:hypothetical protein